MTTLHQQSCVKDGYIRLPACFISENSEKISMKFGTSGASTRMLLGEFHYCHCVLNVNPILCETLSYNSSLSKH